jgi:hypothetical protein
MSLQSGVCTMRRQFGQLFPNIGERDRRGDISHVELEALKERDRPPRL